jgi:CheY-like chemotaxis protein
MSLENDHITVNYERFIPNEEEVREIEMGLERMLEGCPYDSSADCWVRDIGDRYSVEIQVKHRLGQFRAIGEESTLSLAIESATNSAYQSLEYWRRDRFHEANGGSPKIHVLLVDDDPISVKILEACLRQQGCRTTVASTYEQAVADVVATNYDLIVMDWNMPNHDGRETLIAMDKTILKMHKNLSAKIPVITYSMYEKSKIQFPKTSYLRQLGHLRKATPFRVMRGATKGFLTQIAQKTLRAQ